MIDLIISYYNNPEGLARTLASINRNVFYVTIVDDSSSIYMPYNVDADQVLRYNANKGPGFARQFGLDRTYKPYIMFLDTGDILLSQTMQVQLEYIALEHEPEMISCLYYHYDQLSKHTDNRLHGKIYKRSFLQKYQISFPLESSYLNEDIGFNRLCNYIIKDKNLLKMEYDDPLVKQIKDENSLTQKNNQIVLYKDQTRALSLVSIHTIETCRKNSINADIEISQIAIALYYWFIRCAAERSEFIQDAWSGAKIFYNYYSKDIKPNTLYIGTQFIKKCAHYRNQIAFPINILRFVHDIQLNENVPNYYLTKM